MLVRFRKAPLFLLVLLNFAFIKGLSITSHSSEAVHPTCKCLPARECELPEDRDSCGPYLVCCKRELRLRRSAQRPWSSVSFANDHHKGSRGGSSSSFGQFNVFDYKDATTRLNCPGELFRSSDYNNNYFGGHNHHHHHSHHEHHLTLPAGYDFRDESSSSSEEDDHYYPPPPGRGVAWREASERRPIIFPDNKLYTSAYPQTSTTTSTRSPVAIDKKSVLNSPQCGFSIGQRIIGGLDADSGQFPWITRIAYLNKTSNRISYRCSGSVISNLYILTAAHCVTNLVDELELSHLRIGDDDVASTSNIYRISNVLVHPGYDRPKYANDIALVRFQRSANTQQQQLVPICLPPNTTDTLGNLRIGSTGIVGGWSTANNEELSAAAKVKYLRLPVVNTTECAITYAKYSENFNDQIVITPSQLCAQGQPMNDVCKGDSGGPFMVDDSSDTTTSRPSRYTIMGIVAFGPTTCGVSNIPGVYTRVSSFIDWIVGNIL